MGAVCASSDKANGEHDLNFTRQDVAAVPYSEKDNELDASVASVSTQLEDEPDAIASTHSDAGSSARLAPPLVAAASTAFDLLKVTESRPASAAAAEWQSPNHDALRWADGASYTGGLRDGKMNGHGKWTSADGSTTYAGEWSEDLWHGQGELVSEVGTYDGGFWKGAFDGEGTMHWTDHRYYEGEWKQGKRHGYGLNVGKFGQQRVGYWNQNRFVGFEEEKGCLAWGTR